ncbi:MAG: SDR family NAD(P)-dependent oxidoreductase [Planctomycetota bacterium]|jgi:3-oxoacyl-ACP reductase-like protein|nr:SDR family NAD(P)-dependent oxidoreductase [Planctomycetota bacterium]
MAAEIGTWIGTGASGSWSPQIDPAMVDDPRFGELLAPAKAGVSFEGAVVLVTGASNAGSIGYQIAKNFAQGGASVVITGSRDLAAITATAEQLAAEAGAGRVAPARVNQGELSEIDELLDWAKSEGLAFTHVYPFAAINHPQIFFGIKAEDYARVFGVNVFGVYHLCAKHCRMAPRKDPWYVVVPLSPNDGRLQGSGLYPASKQALRPLVVQGQNEIGNRRGGTYVGVDIAWTRSALMEKLDAGVAAAQAAGLKVFETMDTADVCTLLGTPAAKALAGTSLDAGGGFGSVDPADMAKVMEALGGH